MLVGVVTRTVICPPYDVGRQLEPQPPAPVAYGEQDAEPTAAQRSSATFAMRIEQSVGRPVEGTTAMYTEPPGRS